MKAVIGIDLEGTYRRGTQLLARLDPSSIERTYVQAIEPVIPDATADSLTMTNAVGELMRQRQVAGQSAIEAVRTELGPGSFVLDVAGPAELTLATAEDQAADLIVVGSERKSRWSSLFLGSVAKGITIGATCSVLVGKLEVGSGPVSAVLATDGSPYMERCVEELIRLGFRGLKKVTVLSACEPVPDFTGLPGLDAATHGAELQEVLKNRAEAAVERVSKRLHAAGIEVTTSVAFDDVNESIRAEMARSSADLVILGAQGHGFLERLTLGSVSMHQVVAEPFNALILRV